MIAANPRTNSMLAIFEPRTLPITISVLPVYTAKMDETSSGRGGSESYDDDPDNKRGQTQSQTHSFGSGDKKIGSLNEHKKTDSEYGKPGDKGHVDILYRLNPGLE